MDKSPKGINEIRTESLPFKNFPAKARKSAKTNPIKIAISIGHLKLRSTNIKRKSINLVEPINI